MLERLLVPGIDLERVVSAARQPLDLPSLAAGGIPDDAAGTLAIAATGGSGSGPRGLGPRAVLLADAFDVDAEGFLVARS
jgi:hypothetical protein